MAQTENQARSWSRLDGVDLLRALAIFFVLMNHVNIRLLISKVPYTKGLPQQLVDSLVWNGQDGVQIFFAVSGFLITSTTLRRWGSLAKVNVLDFYRLRFARIAPLLLTLLAILSLLHATGVNGYIVQPKTGGLWRALLAALTFHVNVLEARRGYLPPSWDILWSLSVEETFYLFFPLLCRLLGRGKIFLFVLLGFVALGPFARTIWSVGSDTWREYSYLGGMDAIALGSLTALLVARWRPGLATLRCLGAAGLAMMAFILAFSVQAARWGLMRSGLSMTVVAIGTCMVIVAAAQTQWRAPRGLAPVLSLGRRSYEVYLTHVFIVLVFLRVFLAAGKPMRGVPIYFVATILVSALLGEIVGRFYSEPMNRWLRRKWGDGPDKLGSVVDHTRKPVASDAAPA